MDYNTQPAPCMLGRRTCRQLLPVLLLLFLWPAASRPHSSIQPKARLLPSISTTASGSDNSNNNSLTRIEQATYNCGNNGGTCVSKAAQLGSPSVPTFGPQDWEGRCSCPDLAWLRWVMQQLAADLAEDQ